MGPSRPRACPARAAGSQSEDRRGDFRGCGDPVDARDLKSLGAGPHMKKLPRQGGIWEGACSPCGDDVTGRNSGDRPNSQP